MFKIFLPIFLIFALSSCISSNGDISNSPVQKDFVSDSFSMKIPISREVLENTNSIFPNPSNGEVVFDAVSKTSNDSFYRNILVLKQVLPNDLSSLDFTIGNYISSTNQYFYSRLLSEKNVFIDSKKTKIYEFEARYSDSTPIAKFLQTGIICDKEAFLITIAVEKSNLNLKRYESLLGSFVCK